MAILEDYQAEPLDLSFIWFIVNLEQKLRTHWTKYFKYKLGWNCYTPDLNWARFQAEKIFWLKKVSTQKSLDPKDILILGQVVQKVWIIKILGRKNFEEKFRKKLIS